MRILCSFILFSFMALSANYSKFEDTATFSARISKLNKVAKLMRLKINFANAKFLRKKDRIEFWNETYPAKRCMAYLEGRTSEYLLLKIPRYNECISNIHMTVGTYLHLYSEDLSKGIEIGKSLVEVLMKKKFALQSRLKRFKNNLDAHVNRVDTINRRYEVLKQKLELEWKNELTALEEDKVSNFKGYKSTKARLDDLLYKLEQYRIHDENLTLDRWSLDPNLYIKK